MAQAKARGVRLSHRLDIEARDARERAASEALLAVESFDPVCPGQAENVHIDGISAME